MSKEYVKKYGDDGTVVLFGEGFSLFVLLGFLLAFLFFVPAVDLFLNTDNLSVSVRFFKVVWNLLLLLVWIFFIIPNFISHNNESIIFVIVVFFIDIAFGYGVYNLLF